VARSDHPRYHPKIGRLVEQLERRRIGRRDFLRTATLLGLSAPMAYGIVGRVLGEGAVPAARADTPRPGGTVRVSMRIPDLRHPHTYSWAYDANVCRQVNQYLTRTGIDNVTRPLLLESWEVSDDLKTWDLHLRQGVSWSNGEPFVAEHVAWNLRHMLDPEVGSSVLGLMEGYMLTTDEQDRSVLWDENAIEVVDDRTLRLNCKEPQLAVPEHLFHYPALMLHPDNDGEWGVGAVGTGAFTVEEIDVGRRVVLRRREEFWGEGPWIDELQFIDHGDDPAAEVAALSARQVHGQYEGSITQYQVLRNMEHLTMHEMTTSQTGVARMKVGEPPFDDPRVRKAMRLALDPTRLLQIAHLGIGSPGEHHHVEPIHPEYADIGFLAQDLAEARRLLAEAGHPDGFRTEIHCKQDPEWELIAVQAMVEMWREIGVEVAINVLPSAQFWEVWTEVPFGFTPWTHRPLGVMVLNLAYRSGGIWNESDYSNPEFDALLGKAEGIADPDERRVVMADIQRIMLEDGPACIPLWRGLFSFWDRRVMGFEHHPTSVLFGEEIWLDDA
jgi:peptide/nickel transport system substrate-binding protein